REDPQQEVRPRGRIVRALDDERRTPARIEALADPRLGLGEVEALLVPLQHGVAADAALFVAAFIGTPATDSRTLPLADRGRARPSGRASGRARGRGAFAPSGQAWRSSRGAGAPRWTSAEASERTARAPREVAPSRT